MKVFILCILLISTVSATVKLKVGAIFFPNEVNLTDIFTGYINRANQHPYNDDLELVPRIRYAVSKESYDLQSLACELIEEGVVAIFGPSSKASSDIISSLCNTFGIPHILFDPRAEESIVEKQERMMTLNVYPDLIALTKLYTNIIHYLMHTDSWTSWTIIYDSLEGLSRLQDVLQVKMINQQFVKVWSIEKYPDTRVLWKEVKLCGARRIILDCSPDIVMDLIESASKFNITTAGNSFLLTHLDTKTVDIKKLDQYESKFHIVQLSTLNTDEMPPPTQVLVLSDAVYILAEVLRDYLKSVPQNFHPPRLTCSGNSQWRHGQIIVNNMKLFPTDEQPFYTKTLRFGAYNEREHFAVQMETIDGANRSTIEISSFEDFQETKHTDRKLKEGSHESPIRKKNLIVVTRLGEPYVMNRNKNGSANFLGNEKYEGYAIDLISRLAEQLEFTFQIEVVEDGNYGSMDSVTKQWNGLVGQLVYNKADLGICDLTITPERRSAVDFTVPFMSLGISILYYNEPPEPPDLFSFLQPFALEVWVYMATAYLILSILLFFMARISKNEWENPHPCNPNPEELENLWNLSNTTWLTMGSIMGQGCDILPKSGTMRLVSGMWWFFALMMLNSYTANLAAFLTSSRIPSSIESIEDLAGQTKIKFGTVRSGSTRIFFKESNDSTFRQVFSKMETATPSVYTSSNIEGLERIKKGKGKYAFLMETTSLQYLKERNCDVTQIGGQIGQKHYGIALPLGSPYRSQLSVQILRMSERGELFKLKEKWWQAETKCPTYGGNDSNELSIEQLGGVFLVLGCGIFVGFIIGIFEFIWNVQRVAVDEKVTPFEAFKSEASFAMKFWIKKKPIRSSDESTQSGTGSGASTQSAHSNND